MYGEKPRLEAEKAVKIITDKMEPYEGDMRMLDFRWDSIKKPLEGINPRRLNPLLNKKAVAGAKPATASRLQYV